MAHEFISPGGSNLTSLFESIQNLRENKPLKSRIYLVEGKPMRREKVFGPVQRAANESPQDILLIRLHEYVTRLKVGFNAHFMKLLAQEITSASTNVFKLYDYILNSRELDLINESFDYGHSSLKQHLLVIANLIISDFQKGETNG